MELAIDSRRCEGHGLCYGLAPGLVEPDDDGHGVVVRPDVPGEFRHEAELAVSNCPERAVLLEAPATSSGPTP